MTTIAEIESMLCALSALVCSEHESHVRVESDNPEHYYGAANFVRMQALCHEIAESLADAMGRAREPLRAEDLDRLGWAIEYARWEHKGNAAIPRALPHVARAAALEMGLEVAA